MTGFGDQISKWPSN